MTQVPFPQMLFDRYSQLIVEHLTQAALLCACLFVFIPVVNGLTFNLVPRGMLFCAEWISHAAYEVGDTVRLPLPKLQRLIDRIMVFFENFIDNFTRMVADALKWYWRSFWIFYASTIELVISPVKGLVGGLSQREKANLVSTYDWIVSKWDRIKHGEFWKSVFAALIAVFSLRLLVAIDFLVCS
jgi:hypothetical protein